MLIQRFVSVHTELEHLNEELEDRVARRTGELRDSLKEKDRILGIVAHDLKNPIGAIKVTTDLIQMDYNDNRMESIEEYLGIIYEAVHQSMENIEALLSMARLDEMDVSLNTEKVDLASFLNSFLSLYEVQAREKQITFTHQIPQEAMIVSINKSMFTRVIDNLLSNALKFTPANGKVNLQTSSSSDTIQISITDSGIGIPDTLQERVFQRFGPAGRPGTRNEKSTGLGLSIVKTIVEKHGGKVWLKSQEGIGSTFFVEIPSGAD